LAKERFLLQNKPGDLDTSASCRTVYPTAQFLGTTEKAQVRCLTSPRSQW